MVNAAIALAVAGFVGIVVFGIGLIAQLNHDLTVEDKQQERSRLERTLSEYSTPNAALDAMAAPILGGRPHAAPPLVELRDVDELEVDPDLVP